MIKNTLIIYLFFTTLCFAVENPIKELLEAIPHNDNFTEKQIQFIAEEIKLQSLIIESVQQIEISNGVFVNATKASSATRDIIIKTSLAKYVFKDELAKRTFKEFLKEVYTTKTIKQSLIDIQQISKKFISWQAKSIVETARTQGLIYSLVKFISLQMDTTVPFILMASGNIAAGTAVLVSPVSPVVLFPFKVIKDTYKSAVLIKKLGLGEAISLIKLNQQIKKKFNANLLNQLNLINAKMFDEQYIIRFDKRSSLKKIIGREKYNKSLNLDTLRDFLNQNNALDGFIEKLNRSRVPDELKLLTLITAIENSNEQEIKLRFLERFDQYIYKSKNIDISSNHRAWILKTAHAKDFNSFYHQLRKIPSDLHPQILDKVWRNYIFPNAAKNIEGGITPKVYITFRELEKNYNQKVRNIFAHEGANEIDQYMRGLFVDTVFKSLSKIGGCELIFTPIMKSGL